MARVKLPRFIRDNYQTVTGQVIVRGVRSVGDDKMRYGLSILYESSSDGVLKKTLRLMTMDLERKQLRRMART